MVTLKHLRKGIYGKFRRLCKLKKVEISEASTCLYTCKDPTKDPTKDKYSNLHGIFERERCSNLSMNVMQA